MVQRDNLTSVYLSKVITCQLLAPPVSPGRPEEPPPLQGQHGGVAADGSPVRGVRAKGATGGQEEVAEGGVGGAEGAAGAGVTRGPRAKFPGLEHSAHGGGGGGGEAHRRLHSHGWGVAAVAHVAGKLALKGTTVARGGVCKTGS